MTLKSAILATSLIARGALSVDIAFVNGNGGIMSEECALLLGVER